MNDLIYILAASHSGSTLLALALNAHPEVCTVGELKAATLGETDRYRCSCGVLIRGCPFWSQVSDGMARRGLTFDITRAGTSFRSDGSWYTRTLVGPLHRGRGLERIRDAGLSLSPAWRSQLAVIQDRNAALVDVVLEITAAKAIVDSSKNALRLKYLLRNPRLNVKVIRLIRDGRAVSLTYMDPGAFADARDPADRWAAMGNGHRITRLQIRQAAYQWRRCNEEAEYALRRLDKSRWLEVRYEELCADPRATLGRVFGFIGVDPGRWEHNFRSVEHHVLGNGMRLDSTPEIRLDERWRSVLTDRGLRVFDSVAGEMNRRYGYGVE